MAENGPCNSRVLFIPRPIDWTKTKIVVQNRPTIPTMTLVKRPAMNGPVCLVISRNWPRQAMRVAGKCSNR